MKIREMREKKGITRAKLAVEVGVSITAIQNWENDTSKPSAENQEKLDKILA